MNKNETIDEVVTEAGLIERVDIVVVAHVAQRRDHPAARTAEVISWVADQPPLIATAAAVTAWGHLSSDPHLARTGRQMLVSVLLATAMKTVVKRLVIRSRPHMLLEEGVHEIGLLGPDEGRWQSFPSGHTAGSVAMARALARCRPEAAAPAYAAAAFIGLLQLPRGAHYPTDVLAGAVIGLVAEAVADAVLGQQGSS